MDDMRFPNWLRRPTMMAANSMYLIAIAGSLILQLGVAVVCQSVFGTITDAATLISAGASEVLCFLLPPVLYAVPRKGVARSMRLNPPSFRMMAAAAFAGPIVAIFSVMLGSLWAMMILALGGQPLESSVLTPTSAEQLLSLVLPVVILPGICEEVLFRGLMMGAWERRGVKAALIVTTLLFAALHPFQGLPVYLIAGLVLGFVTIASNSLYVSMTLHSAYNFTSLALSMFISNQQAAMGSALTTTVTISAALYTLALTLVTGTLAFGALLPFILEYKKRDLNLSSAKIAREGMDWPEYAVLAVGVASALVLYAVDVGTVFGWFTL